MADHEERPPSALAHGPVKSDDIARLRRDVDESDAHVARDKKTSAARREAELRHEAEPRHDTGP
jgi:hypothetical protein